MFVPMHSEPCIDKTLCPAVLSGKADAPGPSGRDKPPVMLSSVLRQFVRRIGRAHPRGHQHLHRQHLYPGLGLTGLGPPAAPGIPDAWLHYTMYWQPCGCFYATKGRICVTVCVHSCNVCARSARGNSRKQIPCQV